MLYLAGSTALVVLMVDSHLHIANVGDCRAVVSSWLCVCVCVCVLQASDQTCCFVIQLSVDTRSNTCAVCAGVCV